LVLALIFNVINLFLYIMICYYTYKLDFTQPLVNSEGFYICNEDLLQDLKQVHSLSTLSAYSTNTVRGSISILAMTMSTSFTLMVLNVYYNAVINDNENDVKEWFIIISYSALILVGLFPSDDIMKRNNEPIRTWNIFFFTTIKPLASGILHAAGALLYLFIPTIVFLSIYWYEGSGVSDTYFILGWFSAMFNLMFLVQQIILFCLKHRMNIQQEVGELNEEEKANQTIQRLFNINVLNVQLINSTRKILYAASYTIELVAFPLTTFQYLFIELNTIIEECGNL